MTRNRHRFLSAARTLMIFGEGKTERAFASFLKNLFVERNSGVRITIDSGNGGSPDQLIQKVSGKLKRRSFDDCVIMMDTDLPWPVPLPGKINKTRIHFAGSDPCIEGVFLKLLNDPNYNSLKGSSTKCKRYFHKNYLEKEEKYHKDNYSKIFKKNMLLKGMLSIPAFANILHLMGVKRQK